jgi:hypothetical protein
MALVYACSVGPFLASHLNEPRACSGESEDLFFAGEDRACPNHMMSETLRKRGEFELKCPGVIMEERETHKIVHNVAHVIG